MTRLFITLAHKKKKKKKKKQDHIKPVSWNDIQSNLFLRPPV